MGACGNPDRINAAGPDSGEIGNALGHDSGAFVGDGADTMCDPGSPDETGCACEPPSSRACYTGSPSTRGVGACHDGVQTCVSSGEFAEYGACTGSVLPTSEDCSSITDTNCNGKIGCADPIACPSGCQDDASAPGQPVSQLAAGGSFACAITSGGDVECWGDDTYGQLGDGAGPHYSALPVHVVGLSDVLSISAGDSHTCALTANGAVYCWGWGPYFGGGSGGVSTPIAVAGLTAGVSQVASGYAHVCVLLGTGSVQCWGGGGLTDPGADFQSPVPNVVPGLLGVATLGTGDGYACALLSTGGVECWGGNILGELGRGSTSPADSPSPLSPIGLSSGVQSLGTAGGAQSCVVLSAGGVECWGDSMPEEWEAAGCGGTTSVCSTPVVISGFSASVASVAAGWEDYACALLSTGGVECWGSDAMGQLGDGLIPTSGVPVPVSGLGSGVAEVVAGGAFACARMMDGTVKCWGDNTSQQLGAACPTSPSPSMCSTPVGVVGL